MISIDLIKPSLNVLNIVQLNKEGYRSVLIERENLFKHLLDKKLEEIHRQVGELYEMRKRLIRILFKNYKSILRIKGDTIEFNFDHTILLEHLNKIESEYQSVKQRYVKLKKKDIITDISTIVESSYINNLWLIPRSHSILTPYIINGELKARDIQILAVRYN